MIRKIIKIDEEKCNGCGTCANACHEGAIQIINGKAILTREDYCDGLGDCLPACPTGAITFEEREAPAYDEKAVLEAKAEKTNDLSFGCPGSALKSFIRENSAASITVHSKNVSQLTNWPIQIKLVPVSAPFFNGSKLLIAADCSAYAYSNFHNDFIKGNTVLIGCPKLDGVDYTDKLTHIIKNNNVKSITVTRMEVPCCGGIEAAVKNAIMNSGKHIPYNVVTISSDGNMY